MKIINNPDYPVTDDACKAATGRSFGEWFAHLDSIEGLKIGRRESVMTMLQPGNDPWWPTTIYVAFEAHKGIKKKDGLAEGFSICSTKTISAPVEKVYATWTDPGKFKEMFGDNGKQEVKDGGAISCDQGCKGTFTRIRENKDLRFTWEHPGCTAPMQVDVMFQDNKGKTLMNVMTARIQTRAESDGLRNAWGEALSRLKVLAES